MNIIKRKGSFLPLMEAFLTIQGEGFHTGLEAYFIRLGGCDIGCHWCDTKDSWNSNLHPVKSVEELSYEAKTQGTLIAVVTGGEPTMHNLKPLTTALREQQIKTHIETAGTYPLTGTWDWICLSPKKNAPPKQAIFKKAQELKVVIYNSNDLLWAEENSKKVSDSCKLYLQPEWTKEKETKRLILEFIEDNPKWNLSIQTHKHLGIR